MRIKKQEREAIKSGYSAMKRAMSIVNGDPDKKMMFDQAMEAIVDDISSKIGEMERFIEVSSTFIESIDLQNGVYEQKGLELLQQMENQGISLLLTDNKSRPIEQSNVSYENTSAETENNKYKNLF